MTDQFLGEIRAFGSTFAPSGWALCNGQLVPISQNTALFSLLGTYYGGDGKSTFALPNLMGAFPLQQGQGAGLSAYYLGESGGEQSVTLLSAEMPGHSHTPQARDGSGNTGNPAGATPARASYGRGTTQWYSTAAPDVLMHPLASEVVGGGQPHNNMPPFVCVSFIISLQGIFPPRP